jgi:hypothetical protein
MTDLAGPQNQARVRKVVENLDLIHKSARSQKAGPDEERELLAPVFKKLAAMGWHLQTGATNATSTTVRPQWDTVREMSREATLRDLTYAMAVFLNRIDEELNLKLREKS